MATMTRAATTVTWQVWLTTPVGLISAVGNDSAVLRTGWRLPDAGLSDDHPLAQRCAAQLREYFAGDRSTFDLPIDLSGLDPLPRAVLAELAMVGYGKTVTYAELAARSGTGAPARGIGAVMRANPLPLVIGCHRVVAADGLGGFSGGERGQALQTKRWLLEHEGALPATLW